MRENILYVRSGSKADLHPDPSFENVAFARDLLRCHLLRLSNEHATPITKTAALKRMQ